MLDKTKEDLKSEDASIQLAALANLQKHNSIDAQTLTLVIKNLTHDDECVRCVAAEVLGQFGHKDLNQAGPALLKAMEDVEFMVRDDAVESVGRLQYEAATPLLSKLLDTDPSFVVRASAAEALGYLNNPNALTSLVSALEREECEAVRGYIVFSMSSPKNGNSCLEVLRNRLHKDPSLRVKARLLWALFILGDTELIEQLKTLIPHLSEDDAIVLNNSIRPEISRINPSSMKDVLELVLISERQLDKNGIAYLDTKALKNTLIERLQE